MTEVEQQPPPTNGIDLSAAEDDDNNKSRPADIEQDMREMERRKRVEAIMGSKLFREELERIVDAARSDGGGPSGILQQLSEIVGLPVARVGSAFKSSNCLLPINDIRGVESMGYAKGEKILRCKLAATFRLLDLYGWTQGLGAQITARLKVDQEYFLVNPYGLLFHEITASSLNKVDMQGHIVEQGTTNFGVNKSHFVLHSAVHAARPDIRCAIYVGCSPVVAISSLKTGLLPLTRDACVLGEITTHAYTGALWDADERDRLVRNLGPNSKVMLLTNHGALCCGETIEEAFFAACHIVQACETQLKLLPVGVDNLVLIPEESRKVIYDQARRPPDDLEKKFAAEVTTTSQQAPDDASAPPPAAAPLKAVGNTLKWRVGGAEFEALMRTLDNGGYRTGYIYRHPLIKSDPPKPKNDVELPPAVSSLGYLLEEEELFRQGIWKKGDLRKGGDRSRWLNSPNVYQKVEVLETGTPDPKKITKWVAEGSPTHSTPVRIEDPLQFVPAGTNPKEFKRLQQQIKDNRRADKISAGPQSHILEGVTWDEANRIKDATVSSAGDHVVLMGAASKGIIQRGYQHNAAVYKAPYAKNPFDNVTDDELNEYKRTVERKKKSIHGEYTDTDFSESEPLSSLQTSGAQQTKQNTTTTTTAAVSQSEPEDVSEHQVMRIETQQAPVPSQPEVVLSDATLSFLNGERSHTATNRKPPTGRVLQAKRCELAAKKAEEEHKDDGQGQEDEQANKENIDWGNKQNVQRNTDLIDELRRDALFQRQQEKFQTSPPKGGRLSAGSVAAADPARPDFRQCSSGAGGGPVRRLGYGSASSSNIYDTPKESVAYAPARAHNHCCYHYDDGRFMEQVLMPLGCQCQRQMPSSCHAAAAYEQPAEYSAAYETAYDEVYKDAAGAADCYSGVYGAADYDQPYGKSIFCYTPTVCDYIFAKLRQQPAPPPSPDAELIWNIPFASDPLSPAPSTVNASAHTPRPDTPTMRHAPAGGRRRRRQSSPAAAQRIHSPYRTVSHFGFNSPQRDPLPAHKHTPLSVTAATGAEPGETAAGRYVPLRKVVSYEEIFSSPRYVDLCENCFEKIVRLKPELVPLRMRLRNLADMPAAQDAVSVTASVYAPASGGPDYSLAVNCGAVEGGSCASSDSLLPFCSAGYLEPLIEETEEGESSENRSASGVPRTAGAGVAPSSSALRLNESVGAQPTLSASSAMFLEKIMRMNYSEESADLNFLRTPHTVTSNLTLELIDEEEPEPVNAEMAAPPASGVEAGTGANSQPHATMLEIWDFGNWQAPNGDQHPRTTANEAAAERDGDDGEEEGSARPPLPPSLETRGLMSREERSRRKLEFQELWEDHIVYFDGKEHNGSFSDTESAIDETNAGRRAQQQQRQTAERVAATQADDTDDGVAATTATPDDAEVYYGRSVVRCRAPPLPPRALPAPAAADCGGDCASDENSSHGTFNIYATPKREFFRGPCECAVAAPARNDAGVAGEIVGQPVEAVTEPEELAGKENGEEECTEYEKETDWPESEDEAVQTDEWLEMPTTATENEIAPESDEGDVEDEPGSAPETGGEQASTTAGQTAAEVELQCTLLFEDLVEAADTDDSNLSHQFDELLLAATPDGDGDADATMLADSCHSSFGSEADVTPTSASQEFNSVEQEILQRIELNHLRRQASIFDRIDATIRNKLTPSRMDALLIAQLDAQKSTDDNDGGAASAAATAIDSDDSRSCGGGSTFVASTPTRAPTDAASFHSLNLSGISLQDDAPQRPPRRAALAGSAKRRSRSLNTPRRRNGRNEDAGRANKTTTPPLATATMRKRAQPQSTRSAVDMRSSSGAISRSSACSSTASLAKRNFILENIRNAAIPRHSASSTNSGKRLLAGNNAQAIFTQNPFGAATSSARSGAAAAADSLSPDAGHIYSFQSKLVRGSPRFWVSLSRKRATAAASGGGGKALLSTPTLKRRLRKSPLRQAAVRLCDSTDTLTLGRATPSCTSTVSSSFALERSPSTGTFTLESDDAVEDATPAATAAAEASSSSAIPLESEIAAMGALIAEFQPRMDTQERQLDDFGAHLRQCHRNGDACEALLVQMDAERREERERTDMRQYVERMLCDAQTYSLSETED